METFGSRLKALRSQWKYSLKEVEERSSLLAEQWGKPNYRISASWLHRVEVENRELSATKLIVLASIYNLTPDDLLTLAQDAATATPLLYPSLAPSTTNLLSEGPVEQHARQWLPDGLMLEETPERTTLLSPPVGSLPADFRRAIVGYEDHYLAPMVLPGSYLLVDTSKKVIVNRRDWNNEFDRPIYLLLTRGGYMSGFCELDRAAEWLTMVPHPLSFASTRRWRYRKEVEVIGTVAAYSMKRAA